MKCSFVVERMGFWNVDTQKQNVQMAISTIPTYPKFKLSKNPKIIRIPRFYPHWGAYWYEWNLSKREHQIQLLDKLLTVEVNTLFASPTRAPWGNNLRASGHAADPKNIEFNWFLMILGDFY